MNITLIEANPKNIVPLWPNVRELFLSITFGSRWFEDYT